MLISRAPSYIEVSWSTSSTGPEESTTPGAAKIRICAVCVAIGPTAQFQAALNSGTDRKMSRIKPGKTSTADENCVGPNDRTYHQQGKRMQNPNPFGGNSRRRGHQAQHDEYSDAI